jgi:hypothetical protein
LNVSLEYALAGAGAPPARTAGSGRRRRAILGSGCVLAAAALSLGMTPASQAATAPAAGWRSYANPLSGGEVQAVYAPSIDDAWAVGSTTLGGTGDSAYIHFNGSAWSLVSGPQIGPVAAVDGTSDSDLWVVSTTTSAHYNGSTWASYPLAIPSGSTLGVFVPFVGFQRTTLFVAGPSNVYAEIPVNSSAGYFETLLEHFNGKAWSLVTSAPGISPSNSQISQVTGSGADDVYLEADVANGTDEPNYEVLHFNGTAWSVEPLPAVSGLDTDSQAEINITGPKDGLATLTGEYVETETFQGYAAQLASGTWSVAPLPFSGAFGYGQTGGTGRAFALFGTSAFDAPTLTLWQWSAGAWTQITNDTDQAMTATANGSGLWTFNESGSTLGLYDAG